MAKRSAIEEKLYQNLQEPVREGGAELIDLRLLKEGGKLFLRLFIDKSGGVGIDDCERVNDIVDPLLDEWGVRDHDYLEVQSPGLDRPLTEARQFQLHLREELEVKLYRKRNEKKIFTGILQSADEEGFVLRCAEEEQRFTYAEAASVRRRIQF